MSVDALTPSLSGIGRYTWELSSRLAAVPGVDQLRFFRNGQWVRDPSTLLSEGHGASKRRGMRFPRWARETYWRHALRGSVFHGPNYFLPRHVEKAVVTVHDLSVFKYPQTHPAARLKQFERDFADSMSRASRLITDSQATRLEVIDYLACSPDKVVCVPLGVSPQFAVKSSDGHAATLARHGLQANAYTLCVSTLEPRKKIGNLLAAYQRMPLALRNAYPLVLVGGYGWLSEDLHREIDGLLPQGWLRYLGVVPEQDLPGLYASARAFAYPSIYEGFGLPVLEAMASGVPVVTSNCSCLPELTQDAALLVNPDDIDALALGIHRSLCDDTWRTIAVDRGLAIASQLTWERCVARTADVYKSVSSP